MFQNELLDSPFAVALALQVSAEEAAEIWSQLLARRLSFVRTFATQDIDHVVLDERKRRLPPVSDRNRAILERTLLGVERKVIAYELDVSTAMIAQILKHTLNEIGVTCTPARVPLPLVLLAHAACHRVIPPHLFAHRIVRDGRANMVLSTTFASRVLDRLAPAERAVLCERLRGTPHADIARKRKTSMRTVANQLATAFRRLGVSGRLALFRRLLANPCGP